MAESTSESRRTSELASTNDASSDASGKVCCVVCLCAVTVSCCTYVCDCRCVGLIIEICSSSLLVSSVTASRANTSH